MDQWNDYGGGGGGYFGNDAGTPSQSGIGSAARQQFLCPVTVRQVLEAPEQGLKVGSLTATMVSLTGIVSKIEIASTTVKFCLSDDTGSVDCLEWLESQDSIQASSSEILKENHYYHVYGCIKFPQGQRRIMVFKIAKVKNYNEVISFMLEVLNANEFANRVKKEPKQINNHGFEQNSYDSYNNVIQDDKDKLTPIQKVVLEAISAVKNPVGWSRLESKLSKMYSEKEMQDTLEKLVCEGHIYTTIDDDHYCCT